MSEFLDVSFIFQRIIEHIRRAILPLAQTTRRMEAAAHLECKSCSGFGDSTLAPHSILKKLQISKMEHEETCLGVVHLLLKSHFMC